MRIVIRADAGAVPEIGTGHVVRAIKLAGALRQSLAFEGAEILFETREHPPYALGGALVRQAGYGLADNSGLEPNSELELASLLRARPDMVILDRLETDTGLVAGLKSAGIFVVTFDDLGQGRRHADLAIHPLLQNVETSPNVFIGYDYLFPVSEEIVRGQTRQQASRVFVSFGGFDHRRLNAYFLKLVSEFRGPRRYDVITSGLDSRDFTELSELARSMEAATGAEIEVHQRPIGYYRLLCASDLAVVSGGLTAFESGRAGVPAIGIPQYEHQLANLGRLEALGCLKQGARNMDLDPELLCRLVTGLGLDYGERLAMSRAGVNALDGKGLERTVELITQSYKRSPIGLPG